MLTVLFLGAFTTKSPLSIFIVNNINNILHVALCGNHFSALVERNATMRVPTLEPRLNADALQQKMTEPAPRFRAVEDALSALGVSTTVTLYLDRCQVDTPQPLVKKVWDVVNKSRTHIGKVVDFGAGDARFARYGTYDSYIGYEIDPSRCSLNDLPGHVEIVNACAFSEDLHDADLCIGNPPYVRNQDLPEGWRQQAAVTVERRTGVKVSGLANAWQYFFLLSLASTRDDGLVALVIPYEWVSRPSSTALREYIRARGWGVSVYRMHDKTFDGVLTTSSITVIDKAASKRAWRYFRENDDGSFSLMKSASGGRLKLLPYERTNGAKVVAKRGLSPGTQEYLTLTEGERARCGLKRNIDVVPCVTSLRMIDDDTGALTEDIFQAKFVAPGRKCWLVRTDKSPSARLQRYLDSVPEEGRQTSTCTGRPIWWKFSMPAAPSLLMATGFRGSPKVMTNVVGAIAVGGVCGIYGASATKAKKLAQALRREDYDGRVVSHSNGLLKLEINQINALLSSLADK